MRKRMQGKAKAAGGICVHPCISTTNQNPHISHPFSSRQRIPHATSQDSVAF
ncbi:predicted protein [Plenodomus lingam JN3]|uniref:Predicted protein n=1 Tax=Leptosphaeria maculans (strain JN3 / isolate v23.1.3 / race Av1-4-5-6-7-8) TaxID=985895 RepID=E4ZJV1_LEPMJ|nr:predicted protein [Plenodomus lingam JN3]CBX91386.1 predicted protein [Plenodomus lingam JN3]